MKKPLRQFDTSRAQVDPALDGAVLASFPRRSAAYAIDWALVLLATQYLWVSVLAFFIAKFYFKLKGKPFVGRKEITHQIQQVGNRLANYGIDERVRRSAEAYTHVYIYGFMALLVGISLMIAAEILFGQWIPKNYQVVLAGIQDQLEANPFASIYKGLKVLSGTIAGVAYFAYITYKWKGQTIGKRIMGLRVVKLNGKPITLRDSFERVSGYTASASLLFTGFFQYFWDVNHQTTHDKIVETIVIDMEENPDLALQHEEANRAF